MHPESLSIGLQSHIPSRYMGHEKLWRHQELYWQGEAMGPVDHPDRIMAHGWRVFINQILDDAVVISEAWERLKAAAVDFIDEIDKTRPPGHVGPITKPQPPKNMMRAGYAITPRRHGQRHREHQYKRPTKARA